ncbi:pectin lyase fold/virulence factor [Truncatella angustata]|uniref:Pectin lyase fold/virulence factor n=1 Tax=Truncatella angustata TaxID=152316 RepID=A0A9P9A1C3_9PEZI|nr:pectin lyase fold/virulence factor [Truncatella angustata]KAH6656870.1 pectin lyase fold/virulence factor [Truncatella angustata]
MSLSSYYPRQDSTPTLPDRRPFGFAEQVTGGGNGTVYIVENMMDLRAALTKAEPRTVYVKGEVTGNQINETTYGDCQLYIDTSNVPSYNFTLYVMALNSTYTDAVKAAVAAGEEFEGRNATEYLALLNRQNGWRGTAQNVQKSWESINVQGDLTLVGWDSNAFLNGVSLVFNVQSNIIIRNLRMTPPRDCFPAPETYPSSWNARYDAISVVTSSLMWLDGNILEDGPSAVAPEDFLWGWKVDRYDGLLDVEDGSDNITFSHNIVANHHKSLLWGGGEKEGPRDIGKMRFTVFGNHFVNSMSRNPLMRFGTFYIANNVFSNYNNKAPIFTYDNSSSTVASSLRRRNDSYTPDFQYDLGIYNMSSVLVSGNYFDQSGTYPDDHTRIFTFNDLATPNAPATFCSPPDLSAQDAALYPQLSSLAQLSSSFNGQPVNLTDNVLQTFEYFISVKTDSVAGGLVESCAKFAGQEMPETFGAAEDVLEYVQSSAGQVGRNTP